MQKDENGKPHEEICLDSEQRLHELESALEAERAALAEFREQHRTVVTTVRESIAVLQDEVVVFCNPRLAELLGRPLEAVLYRPLRDFVHADDMAMLVERHRHRLAGEILPPQCTLRLVRADGQTIFADLSVASMPWRGRPATLACLTDITDRRRARHDMEAAFAKQTELTQLKSRFVSMTSHEFRTPLAAILSSAELLKDHGERLPATERSELVDIIRRSVKRMSQMLENVLAIGRAEAQERAFSPAPVDLRAVCAALVAEACRAAADLEGRAPANIVMEMDAGVAPVLLDESLLRQIVGHLLSNALKYSPEGAEVRLEVKSDPRTTTFVVSDSGIGIPPEDLPHLFETFHRARNVGNITGTGLGMAIVKRAVERHGGEISVASEVGRGTRFTVRLPHTPPAASH